MSDLDKLIKALDEQEIARTISIPHYQARIEYILLRNTVSSFQEFRWVIGDYYQYHHTRCISKGGSFSTAEAQTTAKNILNSVFRQNKGEDIITAYHRALYGTHGGVRVLLDTIAEVLKNEAIKSRTTYVLDMYIIPWDWEQKVKIIRELFAKFGQHFPPPIKTSEPERYANRYRELIEIFVEASKSHSSNYYIL